MFGLLHFTLICWIARECLYTYSEDLCIAQRGRSLALLLRALRITRQEWDFVDFELLRVKPSLIGICNSSTLDYVGWLSQREPRGGEISISPFPGKVFLILFAQIRTLTLAAGSQASAMSILDVVVIPGRLLNKRTFHRIETENPFLETMSCQPARQVRDSHQRITVLTAVLFCPQE